MRETIARATLLTSADEEINILKGESQDKKKTITQSYQHATSLFMFEAKVGKYSNEIIKAEFQRQNKIKGGLNLSF